MDETLMKMARVMAERGTCSRASVGAIFALEGRVLSSGYNGAPRGLPHCVHPPGELSADRDSEAPACAYSVHAEANAVAFAARYGIELNGSTLYTTLSPCVPCAQLILNVGVTRVYVDVPYRDLTGVRLLHHGGTLVFTRDFNLNVFGWRRDSGLAEET